MNERTLNILSVIVSFIGILFLYFYLINYDIKPANINEMTSSDIGNTIKIQGNIKSINENNKTTTITISQQCDITTVIFDKVDKELSIEDEVVVVGRLEEFNGQMQVNTDKLYLSRIN